MSFANTEVTLNLNLYSLYKQTTKQRRYLIRYLKVIENLLSKQLKQHKIINLCKEANLTKCSEMAPPPSRPTKLQKLNRHSRIVVSLAPAAIPICARLFNTVTPDPTPRKYTRNRSQKSALTSASRNLKSSPLLGLLFFITAPSPSASKVSYYTSLYI